MVSVSLLPDRIVQSFPDMSRERAEDVVKVASEVNIHTCVKIKCEKEGVEGCIKGYPQCPTTRTVISRLPDFGQFEEKMMLIAKAKTVKDKVRDKLIETDNLHGISFIELLIAALGEVVETVDLEGLRIFSVAGQEFKVDERLRKLKSESPYRGVESVLHAVYSYCLMWDKHSRVVLQREVAEAFVVQYAPYVLEATRANHSM